VDAGDSLCLHPKARIGSSRLSTFVPFDPAKKTSEATATDATGGVERIVKGAFTVVASLTAAPPTAAGLADELEKQGFRVSAVAAGPSNRL